MKKLVSIIIPSFNRAHIISETLNSVLAQTYLKWECIIIDDGSTDMTHKIVEKYVKMDSRFQYYNRPVNRPKGANACRNYGFEVSKGEYIMFLDSDDICETYCLLERVSLVSKDSSINLLVRDTSLIVENEKQNYSINKEPESSGLEAYLRMFLRYEIPWTIMSALYKREVLLACKFDESLKRFQDVSFNIKVLSRFQKIIFFRDYKIDTYYRVDENKIFNENFIGNMLDSLIVFYEIHLDLIKCENYKLELRKLSCKIIVEYVIPYFKHNKKEANKIFLWSIKSKMYSFNQKIAFMLLTVFLNTGIFKIKSIGMYKFRNMFIKMLNK